MARKFYSIFSLKYPPCHGGDLFPTGALSFRQPFAQYTHCPTCGQPCFPEPGFYYGALFISYIGSGFFCLGVGLFLHWVLGWSMLASFAVLIGLVAILFVWWFLASRTAYLHLVFGFKPDILAAARAGKIDVRPPTTIKTT
ncbi:uncharacterized protein DUF983 [Neolewinella xylanilytica]|uniref:Uncharacterized protein DUF983 n=1 Tax=Neolewinella xylanilytica TaxID=1514080 RepID=A0A2S6IB45_9BACT|nr:DUF983 domain-containing protein [Neolewinella xylanilytica]PPK88718.1 uncharacterized protein DUF983 [Neolewinella xylanilytica]